MKHTSWSTLDQSVTATVDVPLQQLLDEARSHNLHLGTLHTAHSTVQGALAAADPTWCARIIQARVEGPSGLFASPLAPRAAVGPDLACFAVGTRAHVDQVTFRACRAVSWASLTSTFLQSALDAAQTLLEQGATLLTITGGGPFTLQAALPRASLRTALQACTPPVFTTLQSAFTCTLPWHAVRAAHEDASQHGSVIIQALDSHLCVLRLDAPGLTATQLTQLQSRHLGVRHEPPFDVLRALRLKPAMHGRPRV